MWCQSSMFVMLMATYAFGGDCFELRVIDRETQRGIPLVVLTTIDQVPYVTDNAGRIAYCEPQDAGATLFFSIHAPGYRVPKDGFGIAGVRCVIRPGEQQTVVLERENIAERLCRLTGVDRARDSLRLGYPDDEVAAPANGLVSGQDSVQLAIYRDQLYFFWGDTNRRSYPLGLFRTAGAVSPLPAQRTHPITAGYELNYFTQPDGFVRAMIELAEKDGVVWLDGLAVVPETNGRDRLVGHYSHRKSLSEELTHGMVAFDDDRAVFLPVARRELNDQVHHLRDHPVKLDAEHLGSGLVFPVSRVRATYADVMNPAAYRSWTCCATGAVPAQSQPLRKADGSLDWDWHDGPPVNPEDEARWLKQGTIRAEECRFLPEDADRPGRRITLHRGTVNWNAYRQRWILIANEITLDKQSPSMLGEVWYAEATSPLGPFSKAVKILTHDKQSFYNPCHHPVFDEADGRVIYFEGTYTNSFTQSPPTPRYEYNQILYRLDIGDARLQAARVD